MNPFADVLIEESVSPAVGIEPLADSNAMNPLSPYPGMPPLRTPKRPIGQFEFASGAFIYAPVLIQSLALAVRYRSLTLPLLANPGIFLGGMVGESKSAILRLAGARAQQVIAPFIVQKVEPITPITQQARQLEQRLLHKGIGYPVVLKPDQGCRGMGVQLIESRDRLERYFAAFPVGHKVIAQRLAPWTGEAGLLYERQPNEPRGKVTSITLKYPPCVFGDGERTLEQLILDDPRTGPLRHLYLKRHRNRLNQVLPPGLAFKLCFAGSHSRGALFRDGNRHLSQALSEALDPYFRDIQGFYIGRFDIRFASMEQLAQGEAFEIVEINGVSGEPGHIWDPDTPLAEIWRVLLKQYRTLFRIGDQVRSRGEGQPPRLATLLRSWWDDRSLAARLPGTD